MRKELPTLILLLLLSPPLVFSQQKQSSQPKALAFTHVTIIDVAAKDSRRALKPNQTVVVTGDRITAVGDKVRIPNGAQVIDASGKYLYPGSVGYGGDWDSDGLPVLRRQRSHRRARDGQPTPDRSTA